MNDICKLLNQLINDCEKAIVDGEKYFKPEVEKDLIGNRQDLLRDYYTNLSERYNHMSELAILKCKISLFKDVKSLFLLVGQVEDILLCLGLVNVKAENIASKSYLTSQQENTYSMNKEMLC